jgi:hypothetical protein
MNKQIVPQHLELTPAEAALYEKYYHMGHRYANGIACHNVPRIGDRIDRSVDYIGLGTVVTDHNAKEYHALLCYAAEQHSRDYSPFERTAHYINSDEALGSEYGWDAFDSGVADRIGEEVANYTEEDYK